MESPVPPGVTKELGQRVAGFIKFMLVGISTDLYLEAAAIASEIPIAGAQVVSTFADNMFVPLEIGLAFAALRASKTVVKKIYTKHKINTREEESKQKFKYSVYLVTTTLDEIEKRLGDVGKKLKETKSVFSLRTEIYAIDHWKLVFVSNTEDEPSMFFELTRNCVTQKIISAYGTYNDENDPEGKYQFFLCGFDEDISDIVNYCMIHPMKSQIYDLSVNNCQHYVSRILHSFIDKLKGESPLLKHVLGTVVMKDNTAEHQARLITFSTRLLLAIGDCIADSKCG